MLSVPKCLLKVSSILFKKILERILICRVMNLEGIVNLFWCNGFIIGNCYHEIFGIYFNPKQVTLVAGWTNFLMLISSPKFLNNLVSASKEGLAVDMVPKPMMSSI